MFGLVTLLMVLFGLGCSGDQSISPTTELTSAVIDLEPAGGPLGFDIAIRDTITTIDYAAGTLTVSSLTETVNVDENTVIWGVTSSIVDGSPLKQENTSGMATGEGNGYRVVRNDTLLTITDLKEGDVIELRAWQIDATSLLAGMIKLTNCGDAVCQCLEFSDYLASTDNETRIVTFENQAWIGWICPGAVILDSDGNSLTFCDLAVGDYVAVKGYALDGDTLKISLLTLALP